MRHLPRLPALLHIEPSGPFLIGVASLGPVALYRYAPLQAALLSGQGVPHAHRWPEHLKLFVYGYSPVPALAVSQLPLGLEERFGRRDRPAADLRPWDQATYLGWPVYVCTLDQPGHPPACTVANLFERLNLDVLPLPPPGETELGP